MVQQSLKNAWIAGKGATDHNLLPEIKAYMTKARLKRGIELVKLANRIEALKMQEDEEEEVPQSGDMPAGAQEAAGEALANQKEKPLGVGLSVPTQEVTHKRSLSKLAKGAIFREVVLAKVREMKADEEAQKITSTASFEKEQEKK
jgi:calcium/calmodulin-dependent protein kinase I